MSITPAFTRAIHFLFAVPRETNRTEHDSAFVANLASDYSALCQESFTLLDGEQHSYPPSPRESLLNERVGWSDPSGFFATSKRRKVGSLQPTPVSCPRPN
jgi:hypothetical protein